MTLLLGLALAADSSFTVAGYGDAGASIGVEEGDLRFDTLTLAPVFLFRQGDRVLIESELSAVLTDEGFGLSLEYTTIDVDIGPIVSAGLFLTPVGQFIARQHPAWINRLPDFPLPYRVGPLPMNHLGLSVQHAVRVGDFRLTGIAFVDNGPAGDATTGPTPKPTFVDDNTDKGFGGRLGVVWVPELEVGGSVYTGAYGADGVDRYLLLVGDAAWTHAGWLDVRGEYLRATWTDASFQGAWVQAGWKLQQIRVLRRLEPVVRFGVAWGDTVAGATGHSHNADGSEANATAIVLDDPSYELCGALDYWILPNVVVKLSFTHAVEKWDPRIGLQVGWGM